MEVYTVNVNDSGGKSWYQNGQRHRLDGPAIEYKNGDKEWYQNGKLHRLDGPAIDYEVDKSWYQNGQRHRLDGPAIDYEGVKSWYINGCKLSEAEFNKRTQTKELTITELETMLGYSIKIVK